jgi:hypothetical protein
MSNLPKPSRRKLSREVKNLGKRVNPLMFEHFDAWVVAGIRAGDHDSALRFGVAGHDSVLRFRLEQEILAMAAEIMARRQRGKAE